VVKTSFARWVKRTIAIPDEVRQGFGSAPELNFAGQAVPQRHTRYENGNGPVSGSGEAIISEKSAPSFNGAYSDDVNMPFR
jgi:hypothetical protein